ncbi:hypothetical protein T08_11367 [Trichinella sp. T8]|nr:hypothetical protein T08_11367 [Trichinella sp. T8]
MCYYVRIVMTARAEFQISPSIAYCVRQVNNDVSNGKLNAAVKNVSSCSAFGLSYSLEDSNNA